MRLASTDLRAPGLTLITVDGFTGSDRSSLWVRSRIRKSHTCIGCQETFEPGAGLRMYRPLGNQDYRGVRACEPCAEA